MIYSIPKNKSGFTLTEIIVSLGLFLVAVVISSGSILSLFNASNKVNSLASVMNDLNYSMESMSRDIRFGDFFHCGASGNLNSPQDCANGFGSGGTGDVYLALTKGSNLIKYAIVSKGSGTYKLTKSIGNNSSVDVTGDNINIQYARFYTLNTAVGDNFQPYVIIVLKGYAGSKPSAQSYFNIETMISQRQLNI